MATAWSTTMQDDQVILSNSNLTIKTSDTNYGAPEYNHGVCADKGFISGKYYWEIRVDPGSGINPTSGYVSFGVANSSWDRSYVGSDNNSFGWGTNNEAMRKHYGGSIIEGYGASLNDNDIVGVALDLDDTNGKIEFFKNGVSLGVAETSLKAKISGMIYPAVSVSTNASLTANFGDKPFDYPPEPYEPVESEKCLLVVIMVDGDRKEYELTMAEIDAFLTWYNTRAGGTGSPYYVFNKDFNLGPFTSRKDHLVFDKIQDFEIMEFSIL